MIFQPKKYRRCRRINASTWSRIVKLEDTCGRDLTLRHPKSVARTAFEEGPALSDCIESRIFSCEASFDALGCKTMDLA